MDERTWWDQLSDSELDRRLEQRGVADRERDYLVRNRDRDPQARTDIDREVG